MHEAFIDRGGADEINAQNDAILSPDNDELLEVIWNEKREKLFKSADLYCH